MKKLSRREFVPLLGTALVGSSLIAGQKLPEKSQDQKRLIQLRYTQPNALKKGDTIGICAPAGALKRHDEIEEFQETIQQLGFKTKIAPNISKKYGYFAGSDKERAEDFMSLINDDDVQGIFFIRGGWGCARLLQYLDFEQISEKPKVIMGFSDVTTLLNAIYKHSGLITFHGPNGNSSWNEYSVDYIRKTLMDQENVLFQNSSEDTNTRTLSPGKAYGHIIGGNLSVLTSLIGSEHLPEWDGKILLLEDVGEEPYRIDRMLTQLKLNGAFDQVRGIVLGAFRKCVPEEPHRSFTLEEVFEQHFSALEIPVYSGAQFGHTKHKFTIPIGVEAVMDADKGTLKTVYPGVR